jgi:hypothetical protein
MLVTWYREGTTIPEDLDGATLSGFVRAGSLAGTAIAITGTLTVTDGAGGVFRWDFTAADVATAGHLEVQFNAAFGSGQTPAKTFIASWYVEAAL